MVVIIHKLLFFKTFWCSLINKITKNRTLFNKVGIGVEDFRGLGLLTFIYYDDHSLMLEGCVMTRFDSSLTRLDSIRLVLTRQIRAVVVVIIIGRDLLLLVFFRILNISFFFLNPFCNFLVLKMTTMMRMMTKFFRQFFVICHHIFCECVTYIVV